MTAVNYFNKRSQLYVEGRCSCILYNPFWFPGLVVFRLPD
uniref:Uncharacterized protein n=1 Tax=Anguilla anguilla TaxID=7936 RepID=A0A0E9V5D0_ANGAN